MGYLSPGSRLRHWRLFVCVVVVVVAAIVVGAVFVVGVIVVIGVVVVVHDSHAIMALTTTIDWWENAVVGVAAEMAFPLQTLPYFCAKLSYHTYNIR